MTWFYDSPLENEGGLQALKAPEVGTESDLPSGQEWGLPVFHSGPTSFIYFFYFHWYGIPLPMYYWEYLFNFGFKCFALRAGPHVTIENHPCVLAKATLAPGPDEPWVCVGSRLLRSALSVSRLMDAWNTISFVSISNWRGCYRKWETVAGSLPTALRGSKQSATAISPKLGLPASPLHSGLEWALLLSSRPTILTADIVSPFFFSWNIAALQRCVLSAVQQSDSATYLYTSLHFGSPSSRCTEQSSLSHTGGSH